jgi:hypothetical protein
MYGGLQGLNKSETAAKHGEDQVKVDILKCLIDRSLINININNYINRYGDELTIFRHHQWI